MSNRSPTLRWIVLGLDGLATPLTVFLLVGLWVFRDQVFVIDSPLTWVGGTADLELGRVTAREDQVLPRPNVVFISIDTFAARHLSTYGYGRATAPNLDELASESVLFERCYVNLLCTATVTHPISIITTEQKASPEARCFSFFFKRLCFLLQRKLNGGSHGKQRFFGRLNLNCWCKFGISCANF